MSIKKINECRLTVARCSADLARCYLDFANSDMALARSSLVGSLAKEGGNKPEYIDALTDSARAVASCFRSLVERERASAAYREAVRNYMKSIEANP